METIIYNKALAILQGIPAIRDIDLDWGQLEYYDPEYRPALAFPAALIDIDFPRTRSIDTGDTVQEVDAIVTIRLAHDFIGETAKRTPLQHRNKALQAAFGLNSQVYKAFQKYEGEDDETGGFDRISQTQEKRPDGVKVTRLQFAMSFTDHTADD